LAIPVILSFGIAIVLITGYQFFLVPAMPG